VATVQSLRNMASEWYEQFDLLVLDEAHHYASESWSAVPHARKWRIIGATATPEREDGRPLGDIFDALVQAGNYRALIRSGRLVAARVVSPGLDLGGDWAQNPVDAWARNGGLRAIFFAPTVGLAKHYAEEWNMRRVRAACVHAGSSPSDRADAIRGFESGRIRVLTCCATLTEGIDLPDCEMVIIGRRMLSRALYLQATGRVLRASTSKLWGVVLDLTGATVRHGAPDGDREYSLDGDEPISAPDGGGSGGGPDGIERHDPRVVDVPLVGEIGPAIELAERDPEWWAREKRMTEWYRRNVKRFGRQTADKMQEEMSL
jgi:DNA repair protein RadD